MKNQSYLNDLDPYLVNFLQNTRTDDLITLDGLYEAEQHTKLISTAYVIIKALLKLSANEYSTLFQEEEQTLLNTNIAMGSALLNLRIAIERGSQSAKRELNKIHELLIENTSVMASELLFSVLAAAKRADCPIPKSIAAASQQRLLEQLKDNKEQCEQIPISDSPDDVVKQLMREMPRNATFYDIYEILYGHGAAGAEIPDMIASSVACFLTSKYEKVHSLALLVLLHPEPDIRRAAHNAFIHVYSGITLSALNYSRLFQILYWLPKNESAIICNNLSLDLNNPPPKPKLKSRFIKAAGYFCDGVGCYASTVGFKTSDGYRLAQLLCKETVGIKDTFLIPLCANKKELNYEFGIITGEAGMHSTGVLTVDVTLEALIPQWKHFISVGLENDTPPAPVFLVVSELVDAHYWYPEPLNTNGMLKEFDPYRSGDTEEILEACVVWLHPFGVIPLQSWFVENAALNKLITRAHREEWSDDEMEESVMNAILMPERERWLVRFILCTLILRHSTEIEYQDYLNEFSTLCYSASSENLFKKNTFMLAVGDISIEEAEMRSEEEGHALEVL